MPIPLPELLDSVHRRISALLKIILGIGAALLLAGTAQAATFQFVFLGETVDFDYEEIGTGTFSTDTPLRVRLRMPMGERSFAA